MLKTLASMVFLLEYAFSLSCLLLFQARRGGVGVYDEAFAWEAREFLRKLCIGKVLS